MDCHDKDHTVYLIELWKWSRTFYLAAFESFSGCTTPNMLLLRCMACVGRTYCEVSASQLASCAGFPEAGCDVTLREPSKIGHRVVHCRSLWALGAWPTKSLPAKIHGMRSEAQLSGREAYVTPAHCSFKQWQLVALKDMCKGICKSFVAAQKGIATAQKGTMHLFFFFPTPTPQHAIHRSVNIGEISGKTSN